MTAADTFLVSALRARGKIQDPRVQTILGELVARVHVAADPRVPTACIAPQGLERAFIRVSPTFLSEWVADDDDALYVLLHELLHKVRGDLRESSLRAYSPALLNLAMDISVNAQLARLAFPTSPRLLRRFYGTPGLPTGLLLPPMDLAARESDGSKAWRAFAVPYPVLTELTKRDRAAFARLVMWTADVFRRDGSWVSTELADVYVRGWLGEMPLSAIVDRLSSAMRRENPEIARQLASLRLLGDHESRDRRVPPWCRSPLGGPGGEDQTGSEDVVRRRALHEVLRAVARAVVPAESAFQRDQTETLRGVTGDLGRRDALFLACGVPPTFVNTPAVVRTDAREQVHVYLDVSGSMSEYQPILYGLAIELHDWLGPRAFLFSTVVHEVAMHDVARGLSKGTGGTDFDCVYLHAIERRFSRILMVTDGFARVSPDVRHRASKAGLTVYALLTENHDQRSRNFADEAWAVPQQFAV